MRGIRGRRTGIRISKPSRIRTWYDTTKLARIKRHYKRIDRLELSIDESASQRKAAAELRYEFASETIKRARQGLVERGVNKQARKKFLRDIVRGNA